MPRADESSTGSPGFPWAWAGLLAATFLTVHLICYRLGVCFDRRTLIEYVHFLDPELLRTRLIESLFYLHIQPPLFNLFAGLVLKVTPDASWLFHLVYLTLGLGLYTGAFALQTKLGVGRGIAYLLSSLFLLSPTFVLFEHFLVYELPCAALLVLAALALARFLDSRRRGALAAFLLALFLLCGMRTTFHLGWFALMWGVVIAAARGQRRRVFLYGLAPFLLLLAVPAKNLLLFSEFTNCTFAGKNLWIMTAGNLRWDDKVRLVEAGKLSEVSLVNRWASLDAYPPQYRDVPARFEHIPALRDEYKSNGAVNYNHYGHIGVCRAYEKDAVYALTHRPRAYLIAVALSAYRYFAPATERPVSPENKASMAPLIACYDRFIYGKWPFPMAPGNPFRERGGHAPFLVLLIGLPLLFVFGLYRTVTDRCANRRLLLAFMLFNIFMIGALGCALDFTDTARYRFMTDAFYVALLGMALEAAARWWRSRK